MSKNCRDMLSLSMESSEAYAIWNRWPRLWVSGDRSSEKKQKDKQRTDTDYI